VCMERVYSNSDPPDPFPTSFSTTMASESKGLASKIKNIDGVGLPKKGILKVQNPTSGNTTIERDVSGGGKAENGVSVGGKDDNGAVKGKQDVKQPASVVIEGKKDSGEQIGSGVQSYADKLKTTEPEINVNFRSLRTESMLPGVDVVLSKDSVRVIQQKLQYTLYGYFIGERLAFPVVEYFVKTNWKGFGLQKLMMNGSGFFFFKFDTEKGMMDVLEGGPWLIRNKPIFLNIWTPSTKLKKEDIQDVAVWVKFHDVPLAAYSDDGLSMLATKVGKPKALDSYTKTMCCDNWGRSSYARALIEVSAKQGFCDSIALAIPDLDGDHYVVEHVKVEYEWKPPRCDKCCVFGHVSETCRKLDVQQTKHVSHGVDEDGFTKVAHKKVAKKTGMPMKTQKHKVVYRPVQIKTTNSMGSSSSSMSHSTGQKGTNRGTNVSTNNPFEVLAGKEDRIIDANILAEYAKHLNVGSELIDEDEDDEVKVYSDEPSVNVIQKDKKGASTPNTSVING
jgi:hypothetical protein